MSALVGRTAIVTGAGSGIGEAVAHDLAGRGANVVVASRRVDNGAPVAASIRAAGGTAICVPTDVTDAAAVQRCVARTLAEFGGVEIIVHNALKGGDGADTHGLSPDDLDRVWDPMSRTSVWALLYYARSAARSLRAAGDRGRLVVTSSAAGVTGSPYRPLYAAVKAAQRSLVKALAREWGPSGVTVNAVAPLAATSGLLEAFEKTPAVKASIEARSALGRVGSPVDVAAAVSFLVGDDARYVSGQTLVADGGWFTGL